MIDIDSLVSESCSNFPTCQRRDTLIDHAHQYNSIRQMMLNIAAHCPKNCLPQSTTAILACYFLHLSDVVYYVGIPTLQL